MTLSDTAVDVLESARDGSPFPSSEHALFLAGTMLAAGLLRHDGAASFNHALPSVRITDRYVVQITPAGLAVLEEAAREAIASLVDNIDPTYLALLASAHTEQRPTDTDSD